MSSTWSYVAGIFDGEGTASIASYTRTSVDGRGKGPYTYVQHEAKVCIKNTSIPLMKWLVRNFGGVFYQQDNSKYGWKTSYSWQVKGHKNKENFLLGVLPYLIIKREQALLVLEYLRMDGVSNPEKRKELAARCKQLNQVGTSVETNTLDTKSEGLLLSEVTPEMHAEMCAEIDKGWKTCEDRVRTARRRAERT